MTGLLSICEKETDLSPQEMETLAVLEHQLPLIADLIGADVFLDCMGNSGDAIVVAQANSSQDISAYQSNIVGQRALKEKEPAVYHAFEMQVTVRDYKAVTQEEGTVRQTVVPVFSDEGRCIAVLIREQNISSERLQNRKQAEIALAKSRETPLQPMESENLDALILREMHHRIKNSLQLVASILSLQARRCKDPDSEKKFKENVGRVLSIAAIHDILMTGCNHSSYVESASLFDMLRGNLQALVPEGKHIAIRIFGDSVPMGLDTASAVSLVVNELVTNAIQHAYEATSGGVVSIGLCAGREFHTVTVSDDGDGFEPEALPKDSLGLRIVESMVQERLHGALRVVARNPGTCVSFDFKSEG